MARSFEEPLEPEGLICFKFCTKSHIQSSWLLWPGRVRGEALHEERSRLREERV